MPESAWDGRDTPTVEIPIDAIGDSVCILDDAFTFVAVNSAWRTFADEDSPITGVGKLGTGS